MGNKNSKNILIYSVVFACLLSCVWSNGSFSITKSQASSSSNIVAKKEVSAAAQSVIKVGASKSVNEKVVYKTDQSSSISCKISESTINLNQPADCFSLSIDESQPVAVHLFVQPFHTSQQIVIIPSGQKITSPGLLPGKSNTAGIPALPAVFFTFTAAALAFRRKLESALSGMDAKSLGFYQSYQAMPMRC